MALRSAYIQYPNRGNRQIVAPTIEPVTAAEFRTQVKADVGIVSDTEAITNISQARNFIEEMSGLAFINQTWRLTLDNWPGYGEVWWDGVREAAVTELSNGRPRTLTFPRYPLSSVSEVRTYSDNGTPTVRSVSTFFTVDIESRPGRMGLKSGQVWPSATQDINAIQIDYVAGFGALASDVPPILRSAILTLAAYYYDHRGECDMQMAYNKSGAAENIAAYMVRGV